MDLRSALLSAKESDGYALRGNFAWHYNATNDTWEEFYRDKDSQLMLVCKREFTDTANTLTRFSSLIADDWSVVKKLNS